MATQVLTNEIPIDAQVKYEGTNYLDAKMRPLKDNSEFEVLKTKYSEIFPGMEVTVLSDSKHGGNTTHYQYDGKNWVLLDKFIITEF